MLHEVQQTCTHITIINHGSSLASGTLKDVTNGLGGKTSLHLEVINLKDTIEDAIRKMPFVSEVTRHDQQLTVMLDTADDVRSQISQTITKMGGIIVQMVQSGKDLENVFLQLVSKAEGSKQ